MFIWARILSKSFQVCILNQIVSAMNRYVINRLCVFVLSDYLKGRGEALLPLDGCLSLGVRGLPLVTSLPLVTGRALVGSSSSCSSTAPTYTPGERNTRSPATNWIVSIPPRKILAAIRVVIGSNGAGAGLGRGRGWAGRSMMLNKVTRAT